MKGTSETLDELCALSNPDTLQTQTVCKFEPTKNRPGWLIN